MPNHVRGEQIAGTSEKSDIAGSCDANLPIQQLESVKDVKARDQHPSERGH